MADPDFQTSYQVTDVELDLSRSAQVLLRRLWSVHHDDYAPADRQFTTRDSYGGNARTVALISLFSKQALQQAQSKFDAQQEAAGCSHSNRPPRRVWQP